MIEELVQRVSICQITAKLGHWKTKSYAQHMALGAFYDDSQDAIDSIVEVYQGNFGLIGSVVGSFKTEDPLKCLKEDAKWIAENRTKIAKGLTPVENLIDSLLEIYFQTIYKIVNLA